MLISVCQLVSVLVMAHLHGFVVRTRVYPSSILKTYGGHLRLGTRALCGLESHGLFHHARLMVPSSC